MQKAGLLLAPELLVVTLGVLLRLSFLDNHGDASRNFDFLDHKLYIEWFATNSTLPDINHSRLTYGPPLFHLLGGLGYRAGGGLAFAHFMAITFGLWRLGLFALGLRWLLPGRPLARCFAIALAAVLPAAVHLDGMTNNESLSMLLCWLLMGSWALIDRARGRERWGWCVVSGLLLGTALLTKYSAVILAATMFGIASSPWILDWRQDTRTKLARSGPWVGAIAIAVMLSGWYFARNHREYGRFFPTAFEGKDSIAMSAETRATPIWKRRSPEYFLSWSFDVYDVPHYPSGTTPTSHFFPTLVASTFSAYYLVNFSQQERQRDPVSGARLPEPTLSLARSSVVGGTLLALALVVGLTVLFVRALREKNALLLGYAVAPILAVVGQAYFSVQYPIDTYGVTKGGYLQFAAAPMFAVTGLAVSWCWARPWGRPVAALLFLALICVAAYASYARLTAL